MRASFPSGPALYMTAHIAWCRVSTLLKGRSKVGVKVYDMKKGGELVYEAAPKEIAWPKEGARHVTENEAGFRTVFIGMLAERIARDFYSVELATSFSDDARHLAN